MLIGPICPIRLIGPIRLISPICLIIPIIFPQSSSRFRAEVVVVAEGFEGGGEGGRVD